MIIAGFMVVFLLNIAAAADYSQAIRKMEWAVREQMNTYNIRGFAVAFVDDQQTIHAAGFGTAKKDTIFRAGSISKLFNAVAVMQLVEQGKLDLDQPTEHYGDEFRLVNPFENTGAVTLRQLLCHRAGVIRESPVGGYLDGTAPGLQRTLASVHQCPLVNPPNAKTRYSNVGPTIAGCIMAKAAGCDYERYQLERVLRPLGMTSSGYLLKDLPRSRIAVSYLRVADGRGGFKTIQSPLFDLGTYPAGNLFTTAEDLGRFVSMLAANGRAGARRILTPESLAQMFTPQLTTNATGFGLGFSVGKLGQRKTIGHSGAVYGFSSMLLFLPEAKLGVVVLSNQDIVSGSVRKLAYLGLNLMLEAKLGETPPKPPPPLVLSASELAAFCGQYESTSFWATVELKDSRLTGSISGQEMVLTPIEPLKCLMDGRLEDSTPVVFERDDRGQISAFTTKNQRFTRVNPSQGPAVPAAWQKYLGSYGPAFIPVIISARHGHLYAMTENMEDYRLTPINYQVFAMPAGLYTDEYLVFLSKGSGKPWAINLANMILKRR